jgi:hypothetical protein
MYVSPVQGRFDPRFTFRVNLKEADIGPVVGAAKEAEGGGAFQEAATFRPGRQIQPAALYTLRRQPQVANSEIEKNDSSGRKRAKANVTAEFERHRRPRRSRWGASTSSRQ